jgi:hypothetical protein
MTPQDVSPQIFVNRRRRQQYPRMARCRAQPVECRTPVDTRQSAVVNHDGRRLGSAYLYRPIQCTRPFRSPTGRTRCVQDAGIEAKIRRDSQYTRVEIVFRDSTIRRRSKQALYQTEHVVSLQYLHPGLLPIRLRGDFSAIRGVVPARQSPRAKKPKLPSGPYGELRCPAIQWEL